MLVPLLPAVSARQARANDQPVGAVMTPGLDLERRNERVAGILVAGTVLLVGYASGLGHLVEVAPSPAVGLVPPTASTTTRSSALSGAPALEGFDAGRPTARTGRIGDAEWAPASGVPSAGGAVPGSPAPSGCEPGLASAILAPFWVHLKRAHLDRTPSEQVGDALDTEEYVRTHTALIEDVIDPAYTAATHAADAADPFWMHVKRAHLEESPSDQVADVLDTDRYAQSHTALLEALLSPSVDAVTGSCL